MHHRLQQQLLQHSVLLSDSKVCLLPSQLGQGLAVHHRLEH
jgi:hypothetical protein